MLRNQKYHYLTIFEQKTITYNLPHYCKTRGIHKPCGHGRGEGGLKMPILLHKYYYVRKRGGEG